MTYRLLPPEEWPKLFPHMIQFGFKVPDPKASSVAVAEDENGEVKGYLWLQLALHMEPIEIMDPKVNFKRLVALHEENLTNHNGGNKGLVYYAMTKNEHVARIAKAAGMENTDWEVWQKEIT